MPRSYRFLDLITSAFVAVLLISNIASSKIVVLGTLPVLGLLAFDGGTILFPLAYIFGDILTEVYGYKRSRRVIWTGFFWIAAAVVIFSIVNALPPDPTWNQLPASVSGWTKQDSFNAILGQTPRIVLGSLLAYFAGEFVNSFVLAKLKLATRGRWLWTRTIGSTLVGQAVDTAVFLVVAFAGELPPDLLWTIFVSNYVFKVGVEVLFTPLTYRIVNLLKRAENEDHYDWDTNFNPFALREI